MSGLEEWLFRKKKKKKNFFLSRRSMAAGWWRHPGAALIQKLLPLQGEEVDTVVCVTQDNGVSSVAALMQIVELQGHF